VGRPYLEGAPTGSYGALAYFRMVFELQLRTLAQHIWAVASHKLQYKREASVPVPIRRSINRVSALLEMVDLEFDRVLLEREQYVPATRDQPAQR
jgi:ppGpp synthetase/RelA/SpoT-type nucleotidyltranferase